MRNVPPSMSLTKTRFVEIILFLSTISYELLKFIRGGLIPLEI